MIGGFKPVNLAWVNKVAWLSVYEIAPSYEEGMHVPLGAYFNGGQSGGG